MATKKLTGQGGPGRGQGRKPALPDEVLKVHALRFSDPDWAEIELQGGAQWLRDTIAKARSARLRKARADGMTVSMTIEHRGGSGELKSSSTVTKKVSDKGRNAVLRAAAPSKPPARKKP